MVYELLIGVFCMRDFEVSVFVYSVNLNNENLFFFVFSF